MCRKFILGSKLETIEKTLSVVAPIYLEWSPKIVVSPGDETLIITQQNPKELTLSRFGMTPTWAKQTMSLINARTEENKNIDNNPLFTGSKAIFLKPAFKKPLFSQRCIVIADAFIEEKKEVNVLPKCDLISSHTARKTFVTIAHEKGMPDEDIMHIAGIRNQSTLRRYLEISDQHIKSTMEKHLG
jgi:putative SOS response-associated peptidase YedK